MWTPEEDKRLIDLWNSGFGSPEIAMSMVKTRGAVVGRIHRLRAAGHELRQRSFGIKRKSPAGKKKPKIIKEDQIFETDPYRKPCDIMSLRYFSCRYIVNERPTLYCNQLVYKHSYCQEHFVLCYQQGTSNAAA